MQRGRVFDAVIIKDGVAVVHEVKTPRSRSQQFALCIANKGYPASLELMKVYPVLPDAFADQHELLRVIDESGEDYLYPKGYFVLLDVRGDLKKTLAALSRKAA